MLVSFSLENWMSFREPVTFSMVASRERQHGERVPRLTKYQTRILPIAAIYGGNASGKTNIFKALNFAKKMVIKGTPPDSLIAVEPYRLDSKYSDSPSRFSFELLVDETIYAFSFAVTRKAVIREKLVVITSNSETVLYDRHDGLPHFDSSLEKHDALQFAFRGTQDNQLFLTNSVSQKIDDFRAVYDWFRETLELIAPDSRFGPFDQFFDEAHPHYDVMNGMLGQLDTGITHLGGEEIPFDALNLPEALKSKILEDIKEGESARILAAGPTTDRYIITRHGEELVAKKAITYHPMSDGSEVKFDIRQESDGSQRIIDLLPAFLDLASKGSKKVYVVDELDRSLHTLLSRSLLEMYLSKCTLESRSQLLLTTHDVLLMDQDLFRRDEMWVTERISGASRLLSFSEYKDVRYDKDIRKSYLQGRLGGIPRILLHGGGSIPCETD